MGRRYDRGQMILCVICGEPVEPIADLLGGSMYIHANVLAATAATDGVWHRATIDHNDIDIGDIVFVGEEEE
jgi:hypothetical protein